MMERYTVEVKAKLVEEISKSTLPINYDSTAKTFRLQPYFNFTYSFIEYQGKNLLKLPIFNQYFDYFANIISLIFEKCSKINSGIKPMMRGMEDECPVMTSIL